MIRRDEEGVAEETKDVAFLPEAAFREDGTGGDGQAGSDLPARRRIQEPGSLPVEQVELHEIMGQRVVIDRVLGVHPFPVHDVPGAQSFPQDERVGGSPLLEQIVVLFPVTAGQVVAPALQEQRAVIIKGDGRVGAVDLFLDDDMLHGDPGKRHLGEILVPRLQTGSHKMGRPGIFQDRVRHLRLPSSRTGRGGRAPRQSGAHGSPRPEKDLPVWVLSTDGCVRDYRPACSGP